jgi:hypothetical protein
VFHQKRMHQLPTAKHRIAVNLDDQEFAALAEMSRKHDRSFAGLGRQALLEFFERYGNEQLQLPLRREAPHPHRSRPSDHAPKQH